MNEQIQAAGGYGPPPGGGGGYGPPPGGGYPPPGGGGGFGPPPGGGFGPPPGGGFGAPPGGYGAPPGFGPQPGMGYPPPGFGPMAPRNHPAAIASLVTGILAIVPGCCCGFLGLPLSVVAIVTGIISVMKINAAPDQFTGKGMAIAGLVCGGFAILLDVASLFMNVAGQIMQSAGGGP